MAREKEAKAEEEEVDEATKEWESGILRTVCRMRET